MKTKTLSHHAGWNISALLLLAALTLLPHTARAQTAAELIEKGIYTEETRGDLDAAIKLYQQALDEAKSNEAFAAQALLRLALCHQKLNHTAEAASLLERLTREYPDQHELISRAREFLPGKLPLGPVPWQDREAMILHFRFPAGTKIGMTAYYAYESQHQNQPAWVVGQRTFVGHHSASAVFADPLSFTPIRSTWKHTLIGNASAQFTQAGAKVNMTDDSVREIDFDGATVFDNEQAVHLLRLLPLKVGYEANITIISTLGGGTLVPIAAKVTRAEKLEVPAGTFNALKVELHPVNQSFWFSDDENRYLLRMDAGGVLGDLAEVRHLQPGQLNLYRDDELAFSFNVPADWFTFKGPPTDEQERVRVAILDANADAHCMLMAYPRSSLKPAVQSLKAWAEDRAAHGAKQVSDFKIRSDSWADTTVSGYPAISFIADYTEGEKKEPKAHYCLVVMTREVAANFFMMADADKFPEVKAQFDQVINSFVAQ